MVRPRPGPLGGARVGAWATRTAIPTYELRPPEARWTHIALRVADIDASIAWYQTYTPLELLDRRQDEHGFGAWLGQPDSAEQPFILVLAQFLPATDPFAAYPKEVLAPFAHFGIELPHARRHRRHRRPRPRPPAAWPCRRREMPPPIGYICMLRDPDGNMVEFSYDQGVYAKAREVWGATAG